MPLVGAHLVDAHLVQAGLVGAALPGTQVGALPVMFTFTTATNGAFSMTLRTDAIRTLLINWGDSGAPAFVVVKPSDTTVAHTYADGATKTVVVYGSPRWLTKLDLAALVVFGLDVSGLTRLTYLQCTGLTNTLTGSVGGLTLLTYLNVTGLTNTLTGSVAALTGLTYLYVTGTNTLSGSVAGLTALTDLLIWGSNTLSGSVAGLTGLTYLYVTGSNTLSGSVAGLTALTFLNVQGNNTLTGSIAALAGLTYLIVYSAANTISGSVAALTGLTYVLVTGNNTLSGSIAGLTNLTNLTVWGSNVLSGSIAGLTNLTTLDIRSAANTIAWDVGPLVKLQTFNCHNNALSQAAVDAILLAMYTARANYTFATPTANLGGTNQDPSGVYASVCPPVTGLELKFELVNKLCGGVPFNAWTIVT